MTPCPACAARVDGGGFTARDDALRAAPGRFSYRRCGACGSVFADPQPDDAVLGAAYAPEYGNYDSRRSLVERLAEPLARREAERVVRHAPVEKPLLEVGCGTGRFLERLRRVGWTGELRGVEYAPDVAVNTGARLGVRIDVGTAETVDLGAGEQGVIALRHVIEHLRDPGAFLARARDALRPGALLYLATPDTRALSARVFRRSWWGYEVPRHLVVFSRDGLRTLLTTHGFVLVDEWWNFSPQMWNASLYLALDKGRGTRWAPRVTHTLNPLVTGPAVALGAAEVAARRSTMYSLLAKAA